MSKIIAKKEILEHFKGSGYLEIEFGKTTNIYADNGKGKSTLFDGFRWCLFGTNSQGGTKFTINPLNKDGSKVANVNSSSVTIILDKDGIETTFTRSYKENGTYSYSVNGGNLPMKAYKERVNDIIDEELFKTLTDVYHFPRKKTDEQRELLFDIFSGYISVENILESDENLKPLAKLLETTKLNYLIDDTRNKLKTAKADKEKIQPKIEENQRNIVDINSEEVNKEIETINEEIATIDEEIVQADIKNEEIADKKQELLAKESKYQNEYAKAKNLAETKYVDDKYKEMDSKQNEYDKEYNKLKTEIDSKYDYSKGLEKLDWTNNELAILKSVLWDSKDTQSKLSYQISSIVTKIDNTRSLYKIANTSTFKFDENTLICPTCKRPMDNIEQYKKDQEEQFNTKKANRVKELIEEGNSLKADKEVLEKALAKVDEDVKNTHNQILKLEAEITKLKTNMVEKPPVESKLLTKLLDEIETLKIEIRIIPELIIDFEGMQELKTDITNLKAFLEGSTQIDTTNHKTTKKLLEDKLKALNEDIKRIKTNKEIKKRIADLDVEERSFANEISRLEGINNLLKLFTKTKSDLIADKMDDKFKTISFKLSETLKNGETRECCEATIDGVPYSDVNSAAKINAGLEIISILSEYYQASCPIFIDGCESITHPQETDSQLITLNVQKFTNKDKTINNEMVEAFEKLHPTATKINNMYMEVVE